MTENSRPPILRRARQRTIAIVIGAAVTTGVLAAAIGGQAVADNGTGESLTQYFGSSSDSGTGDSGSTDGGGGSGIGSSSDSGPSDGGSHSS